ncbi:MAG: HDIG domain-containing protein, partial [Prolixibacteraceae bacterium]|nr:HDIG domain-containing protein [Prolixibacteraceae bacterium]
MKTLINNILQYSEKIFQAVLLILTAVALFFILPSEPRFKYEFQKGAPWKHENLIAPFDFSILISNSEIEAEQLEITRSFAPYFTVDSLILKQKTDELIKYFATIYTLNADEKDLVLQQLIGTLNAIYTKGVLIAPPESMEVLKEKTDVWLIGGNKATKTQVSTLLTEKNAYNLFKEKIDALKFLYPAMALNLEIINLGDYIKNNLHYDEKYSKDELQRLYVNVSTARGMVQTGERIILEGEIIDDVKFQVLESLKWAYEKKRGEGLNSHLISIGKILLIVIFLALLFSYLLIYKSKILSDTRKLFFLLVMIVFMVFVSLGINSLSSLHIYLVPLAIMPVVIRTFYDPRTAIFMLTITALLIGFYAPNNYEYVLFEITAGMVAVFSLNRMQRRGHVIVAAILVGVTYIAVFTAVTLIREGTLATYNFRMLQWFALSSLLMLLVYPLIYIFEKLFGFVSDVTLIELSNTNQPLLRKLAEDAPGTFQHSMQIANLAEEVILKIGGDSFLVRTGALYHDIGKTAHPTFFIENQEMGMNPHDKMDYKESAKIIITHVQDGIKLAKKHGLPDSIIEFIATHH